MIAKCLRSLYTQSQSLHFRREGKAQEVERGKHIQGQRGGHSHIPVRGFWSKAKEEEPSMQESTVGRGLAQDAILNTSATHQNTSSIALSFGS